MKNFILTLLTMFCLFAVPAFADNVTVTTDGPQVSVSTSTSSTASTTTNTTVTVKHSWPASWIMGFFGWIGLYWSLLFLAFALIGIGGLCSNDSEGWAFIFSIGLVALWWWSGFVDHTISWIALAKLVGYYIVLGFAFTVTKWFIYLFGQRREVKEAYEAYKISDKTKAFKEYLSWQSYKWYGEPNFAPNPKKMAGDLAVWWGWWPAVLLWDLLSKWVIELWDTLVQLSIGLFNNLSQAMFKSLKVDDLNEKK